MNLFERRNAILNKLCKERHATAADLARMFGVSERTIYSDIEALALDYPVQTVRGRYGGGIELANWFHPYAKMLAPVQEELLRRISPTLAGEDLIVMNSILAQFGSSHGYQLTVSTAP